MKTNNEQLMPIIIPPVEIESFGEIKIFLEQKKEQAEKLTSLAQLTEITDDEEAKLVTDSLSNIKSHLKELETKRKEHISPVNDFIKKFNALFAPITDEFDSAEKLIKEKIKAYLQQKEKRRIEEERKRQEEYEKKINAERKRAEKTGDEQKIIAPPISLIEQTQVRGSNGLTSTSKFWNYEIINILELFRERPDLVELNIKHRETLEAIKTNQIIAGLRVFEDIKISSR